MSEQAWCLRGEPIAVWLSEIILQPFKTSLNVKEHTLVLSSMSAVISMSGSPEHLTSRLFNSLCFLLFSLLGFEAVFVQLLPVISPITIISHCWVCWLSLHTLYFWGVSERLHHDFVSLLSLSVRLLFLIITSLFPVCFSSFQPRPPPSFPTLLIFLLVLVCGYACVYVYLCAHFWISHAKFILGSLACVWVRQCA